MQFWLLCWKRACNRQLALVVLTALVVLAQDAWCADSELKWVSPSRTSTLDTYVEPQPSKLQSTLVDGINRGLTTKPKPKTSPSRPQASAKPTRTAAQPTFAAPSRRPALSRSYPPRRDLTADDFDIVEPTPVTPTPVRSTPRAVTNPNPAESNRVARRLRRWGGEELEATSPHYVPNETMHPTERQEGDGLGVAEPAVDVFPVAVRDRASELSPVLTGELKPLTAAQQRLRTRVRAVLAHYYRRPLNTQDRSPWEIMHAMLSYEIHSKVLRGGPQGEPVSAVGWLCFNQPCKRRTLMYVNDEGELRVRVGPALQGHRGQLLALLAQSKVRQDYPMRVEGHELTVADLIEMEKSTCYTRSELTFKLIGLMHYLPSDARWMNDQGMEWDMPKLVAEELRQPIRGAACGGTHRLSGLTLAYKKRQQRDEPVDGVYLQAQRYVTKHQLYAYKLQNRDGSFSTDWFNGPGDEDNIDRKLKTTGHILEWLMYTATEKELRYSGTTRAVAYLTNIMYNNRTKDWETGPLGHAVHALLLYDRLAFAPYDNVKEEPIADKSKSSGSSRR
jgi:hypothetical protein